MTSPTSPKTVQKPARTRNMTAKPAEAKGTVAVPEAKTVAKPSARAAKPAPAKPAKAEPASVVVVKLSTGTYEVTPRDIETQKVTDSSRDMIALGEALFGYDLSKVDARVLAWLITRKGDLQKLVHDDSPRARK